MAKTTTVKDCCRYCPGVFFGIELPTDNRTFCGFKIPRGRRYVCALEIKRGDFATHPRFHAGDELPSECPYLNDEGGKR